MRKESTNRIAKEKRSIPRRAKLRNYCIEIKFVGKTIYQFRAIDVTTKGAGILIKDDSAFLDKIEVGQNLDVNFISPKGSNPSGFYNAVIKHITDPFRPENKRHRLVGISILKKLD